MIDNIKLIIYSLIVITVLVFGHNYYQLKQTLSNTQRELLIANSTIESLRKDNSKLLEYNSEKEKTINKLEKQYKKSLENIPSDKCGDTKPSITLLKYLKANQWQN